MKLTDMPYEMIHVGLDVMSHVGTLGKVSLKFSRHPEDVYDQWLQIDWSNGNISIDEYTNLSKILVI